MTSTPTSGAVSERMRNTPQRDTPCELAVRKLLHRRGLRYRIDHPIREVSRARPDIVFTRERIAIFIDGCFWHQCPEHFTSPKANSEWWRKKLEANVARDERHNSELRAAGWLVLRFWEHESAECVVQEIADAVSKRRRSPDRKA